MITNLMSVFNITQSTWYIITTSDNLNLLKYRRQKRKEKKYDHKEEL